MESSIAVFLSRQPACEWLLLNQTKRRYAPWTASRDIAHNAVVHRYRHLDPAHGTHTGRTSISDVLHEHTHTHTHTRTHARTPKGHCRAERCQAWMCKVRPCRSGRDIAKSVGQVRAHNEGVALQDRLPNHNAPNARHATNKPAAAKAD